MSVENDPLFDMGCLDATFPPAQAYVHKGFWQSASNILKLIKCVCAVLPASHLLGWHPVLANAL